MIFNRNNNGAEELVSLLGVIDHEPTFSKWEPALKLAEKQVYDICGREVFSAAEAYYLSATDRDGQMDDLVLLIQRSNALFAWLKVIPTLDAQHGNAGRQKRLGDNERGLTAEEQLKDEANIQTMAYDSLDELMRFLIEENIPIWKNTSQYKRINDLLITNVSDFDCYYHIGSYRMFIILSPMMKEVQDRYIIPIMTKLRFDKFKELIKSNSTSDVDIPLLALKDVVFRSIVLLSMKLAIERLPVQSLPENVFQVKFTNSKNRSSAEVEAKRTAISSLFEAAMIDLESLRNDIGELTNTTSTYLSMCRSVGKGVTF